MSETIDVEMEVAVRKYKVDKERLVKVLKEHKRNRTNKEIAQILGKPITLVEHWFRNDNSFAVPEPDIWFELKNLLGITTTEFDQSITEFEFKESNFDSRNRIYASDISPTLTCRCGNHLHLINENESQSSNELDQPTGVFAIDQGGGKSGANFHLDVSPTLTCTHGGEPAVCFSQKAYDKYKEDEIGTTLTASGGSYGGGSETLLVDKEKNMCLKDDVTPHVNTNGIAFTLAARDYKGPHVICTPIEANYIVRRLTPVECARLQGFADNWGVPDYKESLTDEEYDFWLDVRNTYASANGKREKEYTKPQMLTWYNKLHSNGAEYKMWGNGVALPPTLYVMQGIYDVLNEENE